MGLTAGTRLGPYAIVSPIGAGGMGASPVFKVTFTRGTEWAATGAVTAREP
jgi:hypothetical protein